MNTSENRIRPWILTGIMWLIFLGLTIFSFYGRAGGSLGDKEYNQEVVQNYIKKLPGYKADEYEWKPDLLRKPSRFLVVKKVDDDYVLMYQSDRSLNKERWEPEDLDNFDYIVISWFKTNAATYQHTGTGEVATMTSRNGYLNYYDLAERRTVYTGSVGGSLPSQTTTVKNYTSGDDSILSEACERLGGVYFHDFGHYALLVLSVVFGVCTVLLNVRDRKKRAVAGKTETP